MIEYYYRGVYMLFSELTKKVLLISFTVHKDQVDKSAMPSVYHTYSSMEEYKNDTN